jgi:lipopolysaccharide/colanic/teichoic acid biosynthesis glycosyltransferase
MSVHESLRRRWVTAFSSNLLMGGLGMMIEPRRWSATHRADWASGGLLASSARLSAARMPSAARKAPIAPPATTVLPAHERRQIISQQIFRDVLVREHKRAVRFEEPFVVLLVGLDESVSVDASEVWTSATEALIGGTRDTDVIGWVTKGCVLGVLLTEIGASEEEFARQAEARVRQLLEARLDPETRAALSVRLHFNVGSKAAGPEGLWPADPLLFDPRPETPRFALRDALKRGLDILGSGALLLVLAPVFLAIAALIKLKSPGPVFFRQVRVGQKARPFTMLKFRSMHVNADSKVHQQYVTQFIKSAGQCAEAGKNEVFKLTNDPRITPLGHILRKTSLDELPQLWNVLRGDMSLVGPRPPLFYETEQYQAWHWRRVLDAKPGVTGLWQVAGRSRTTFDGMVRLDLRYVRTRSLWTDIKILLATPAAVITGKGAC